MRKFVAIYFLFVEFLSMAGDDGSVIALRNRLHQRGIEVGIHGAQYVFVGGFEMEVENPRKDKDFILKREQCLAKAEISAKRALLQARRMKVVASDDARLESRGQMTMSEDSGSYAFSTKMMLRNAFVLDSAENWNPETKKYQVAVAVSWCARHENAGKALLAAYFQTGKRQEVACVWEEWAKRVDLASVVGTRKFFGPDGALRYVGIGCADVDGLDIASPWMRRAQEVALVRARANLSLALYAEMVSEEELIQLQRELYDSGVGSYISFESYIGTINRYSDKRIAFAPEVYATFAVHPITKRKMFVSVCGYEPWQLAELGIIDPQLQQQVCNETKTKTQPSQLPDVKVWNPNTGKFETVKE